MKRALPALLLSAFAFAACTPAPDSQSLKLAPKDNEVIVTKFNIAVGRHLVFFKPLGYDPETQSVDMESFGPDGIMRTKKMPCDELVMLALRSQTADYTWARVVARELLLKKPGSVGEEYTFSDAEGIFDHEEGRARAANALSAVMVDRALQSLKDGAKLCP
jgi:hypothetical protein